MMQKICHGDHRDFEIFRNEFCERCDNKYSVNLVSEYLSTVTCHPEPIGEGSLGLV